MLSLTFNQINTNCHSCHRNVLIMCWALSTSSFIYIGYHFLPNTLLCSWTETGSVYSLVATTLYLAQENVKNYTFVFLTFMPRHAWLWESIKNQCNYLQRCTRWRIHKVSNNTFICVTFICPGMPGHESIKKTFIIYNVVLGHVTLSQ